MCVPGLNCYSCPAATGACPIGAFQAVVGSSKFKFTYYITGFFILLGVLLGRFICGFLCPFGWFQDLLHKIPGKKFSTAKMTSAVSEIRDPGCLCYAASGICNKFNLQGRAEVHLQGRPVGICTYRKTGRPCQVNLLQMPEAV